jgi:hypothetical protein
MGTVGCMSKVFVEVGGSGGFVGVVRWDQVWIDHVLHRSGTIRLRE